MSKNTNGVGTADWLRAKEGVSILAYVPSSSTNESSVGTSLRAQPEESTVKRTGFARALRKGSRRVSEPET